jgi:hypothetical protein
MEIGNANYEKNGFKRREFFKIKDGEQVYRILPPLGSMAKLGKWARYMRVEWGYADLTGKKKPFQDVREVNRKTGMVEVESEAHIKREALKKQHEAGKAAFRAGKFSKDQLDQLNKIVMNFSLENKHYVNVIDRSGKIGILKIGHKLKLALDSEIEKLRSKGIDPLSVDNGRFFVIGRAGYGLDTTFSVNVLSERINHPELGEVEKPIVHKLDAGIISRLSTEAMDLADLDKLYPSITAEEVKRVVLGTPSDVSEVFARFAKQVEAAAPVEGDGPEDEGYSQVAAPVATAAPVVEVPVVTTTAVGQNVTLGTQSAPVERLQVQSSPVQLSDDDFLAGLASLGIKS